MSAVSDAIAEIDAQLAELAPAHEGWRDYLKVNLLPDTGVFVKGRIDVYDRRVALLEAARAALVALQDDGHPGIPPSVVSPAIYDDLQDNHDTITAAFGTTSPALATTLGLTASAPEPK